MAVPIFSQVLFDGRIQRFHCHTNRGHYNDNPEDNSGNSVIYSTIGIFRDSNQSSESSHGFLRIGYYISDNSSDTEGGKRWKEKRSSKFSSVRFDCHLFIS